MKSIILLSLSLLSTTLSLEECQHNTQETKSATKELSKNELSKLNTAYFASGCFWCVEAVFESVKGVKEAVSGYSGGTEQNPSYQQVGAGLTGHTEAVEVFYDPTEISYKTLLTVYYDSHNPTTVDGQAPDFGSQYRSVIFFQNAEEKQQAQSYKDSLDTSGAYQKPIATEITKLRKFWKAEDYHQDYEKKHPNNGYIRNVSIPRLNRFKAKHPELIKNDH